MITTQRELRKLFWLTHPQLSRERIPAHDGNGTMYTTDTRCAWGEWIDVMSKDSEISERLAMRATL